jgi:peptidyl-prolyl cis-trans isomerase C
MREEGWFGYLRLVASVMLVAGCVTEPPSDDTRAAEHGAAEAREVAARVNGEPIYEDQLQRAVQRDLAQFARYGARTDDTDLVQRMQARRLNELIGNLLVYQESKKRTIENMDEKVEQRVKDLEKKYGAGQGMAVYLERRRMTMDDLRESLKPRVRVDEYLIEQGVLEPEIPEDRIREMYDADPESFSTTETITVSHILIAVDRQAKVEEKEQARQKAEQIRQEILAGSDFAAMAKAHSDGKTASKGGDLGQIKRGYMPAAFDEVAFSLEEDTVSEVVETRFGYHIIEVFDRQPARLVPYEEMRGFLEAYLQDEESKKRLATHIAELRERSEIEILLRDPQ